LHREKLNDMATTDALSLVSDLKTIRNLTGDLLISKCQQIPPSQQLRHEFIVNLETHEQEIVYKGCLLLYTVTNGIKVPQEFQLEATLALLAGWDSLINAGTGSGKTLCMVLPALLDPTSVSLMILPLKQLQILQVTCIHCIDAHI
jgi:ATP-dependent helicase YprA (DUF1998 family)